MTRTYSRCLCRTAYFLNCVWLALAFAVFNSRASESANYFFHLWQAQDGLMQNSVTAIVQTRDGYLWLGTYGGLVRFDGARFRVFDTSTAPDIGCNRVTCLYEDPNGRLWIGFETGQVGWLENGRFHIQTVQAAWKGGKIFSIGTDESGDVWLVNEDGLLARFRDGLVLIPEAGSLQNMVATARDKNGRIWISRGGRAFALERGKLSPLDFGPTPVNSEVMGICASRDGGFWVVLDGKVRRWLDGKWVEDRGETPWGLHSVVPLIEMQNGSLAAGRTDSGLFVLTRQNESLHFDRDNGLPQNWVRALAEDREGNLWIAAGSAGLVAMRPSKVSVVNPPDRWQGRALLSISMGRGGELWVGTEGAGIYRFFDGDWTNFNESDGLSNLFVWSVSENREGRLWAGTWGGGVFEMQSEQLSRVSGLEEMISPTTAILHSPDGVSWVGTTEGLLRWTNGLVTRYGRAEGVDLPDVRTVLQTGDGTIWFGMSGGGLGRLKNGVLQQYRMKDGLATDYVQCLWQDDDGTLWLGTTGDGLGRFKNDRVVMLNTSHGLINNVICNIQEDTRGYLWISTHGGIMRVSKAELNRCANGGTNRMSCVSYGTGEGMPTLECSGGLQPAGCKTADGRLWFPTSKGLVVINPNDVKKNRLPPPVVFEELRVDGQLIGPGISTITPLTIHPGGQRVEFRYTGLSFTVPEKVRFKYRIENLDTEWIETSDRTATYNRMPPGNYTFRVTACNNDGIWNENGASLNFVVLPQFWQTWWFRGLSIVAAAAMVAGSVWFVARRRLRHRLEQLERQRAIERERARIAKDIHDDLGASLTRIIFLSQSARSDADHPTANDLDQIYDTARDLTRAMDEIVWAVNPQHDTLDSLATYLGKFAQDFLRAVHIRCRLDVPMQLPAWPLTAETRHNLFLAFKEALNNAVKHAATSEVRVSLTIESSGFALKVEDNGRGFSPTETPPESDRFSSGNGLKNMEQRLNEIGGSFTIESQPGKGTQVTFFVRVKHRGGNK